MALMGPVRQGNNTTIQYSVLTPVGGAQDVTSWSFLFRVKLQNPNGFVFIKTSTDPTQIAITNAALGLVDVYLIPSDTNPPFNGLVTYLYDFQGTDASGNVFTLDSGSLKFLPILY